jgi:hypothetical protein
VARTALIVWAHGGNLGHLSRLVPIAMALQLQQWDVVFAVADEVATKRYLSSLPFKCIKIPRLVPTTKARTSGPLNHADILLRMGFGDLPAAQTAVSQWHDLFDAIKPAALLVDACPLALYAARSAGLPVVAIGHGYELPPEQEPHPCFMPWIENAQAKAAALETRLHESLRVFAEMFPARYCATAPTSMKELFRYDDAALCTWPELDHFDRGNDAGKVATNYTGPIWSDPPGANFLEWPEGDGPKVLCYLNLRDERYDLIWQTLRLQRAKVLVVSPVDVPRACESARGWGIRVIERPVKLGQLIEGCDAVVGHGGMGLTSMALHSGKPLLLLPEHMEQAILAYRLSKQGFALGTIQLNTKTGITAKVDQLLNDANLKQQAEKFAKSHRGYEPAFAVNRIVAKIVGTRGVR